LAGDRLAGGSHESITGEIRLSCHYQARVHGRYSPSVTVP